MNIFNSPSQHRESLTIWRVFNLLPLFAGLAQGQIFKWFAINIPMNIVPGSRFTSDIDIIGCFYLGKDKDLVYRTWEVKVSTIDRNGLAKSLKAGKTKDVLKQLTAYTDFGSPTVSLLETYVCEPGFLNNHHFPTEEIADLIKDKYSSLQSLGVGYQVMPFSHNNVDGRDIGMIAMGNGLLQNQINILTPQIRPASGDFNLFTNIIWKFVDGEKQDLGMRSVISFCKRCKRLLILARKKEAICPTCSSFISEL